MTRHRSPGYGSVKTSKQRAREARAEANSLRNVLQLGDVAATTQITGQDGGPSFQSGAGRSLSAAEENLNILDARIAEGNLGPQGVTGGMHQGPSGSTFFQDITAAQGNAQRLVQDLRRQAARRAALVASSRQSQSQTRAVNQLVFSGRKKARGSSVAIPRAGALLGGDDRNRLLL